MATAGRSHGFRTAILVSAVVIALSLAGTVARFYTDLLWYQDLGQQGVFWTTFWSSAATGAIFVTVLFLLLYGNALVARRMAPRAVLTEVHDLPIVQFEEALAQIRHRLEPYVSRILPLGCLFLAFTFGWGMSGQWPLFQLALNAVPFGEADPQFGRDIGFYVFSLPALRAIEQWLFGSLVLTLIVTLAVHVYDGAIRPWARLQGFAEHVKAHMSVLLALIVATRAWDYYLDMWELNFSPRGQVTGASYTDVHAQLPALKVLIVIALLSAVVLLFNIRQKGWRLPVMALGVWVGASILIGSVYPALVQQLRVAPNEIAAETPYIERNIAATRKAFGLEGVVGRSFPAKEDLTATDVIRDQVTLENMRLWDPQVIEEAYQQLQGIRPYYEFRDVDIDRYEIDGRLRQVVISVREMNHARLPEQARTWVNQHLVYTHGYGAVLSPVNESTSKGTPKFLVRDVPPVTVAGPQVKVPGIYFGETEDEYVVVNTGIEEFDYPVEDRNATTRYEGRSGVSVGGLARRIAFALRFGSLDLLLSQYITPDSRVLYMRSLRQRMDALAPWLALDDDPYPVVVDGKILWVIDGYTYSDRYPYSQTTGEGLSYLRNAVKTVIDAYDGTVTLYAFDPDDPILATWREIFPELVVGIEQCPQEVVEHFRYPEDLFRIQARVYENYHMLDPQTFYNKEDSWAIPRSGDGVMEPYYVLLRLPGEEELSFLMMQPFTPRNKDNMIAWMAAKSGPRDYGQRIVYNFPKQRLILGPAQVEAAINQDSVISPQLSLWNQRGSQVRFGNLLVIPLKDAVVYVRPLYLQAEQTAIPELTRVLVLYADQVVMAEDLRSALVAVFGEAHEAAGSGEPTPTPAAPTDDAVKEGAARAQEIYEQAIAAQRRGDWATYGRLLEELGDLLGQLAEPSLEATAAP